MIRSFRNKQTERLFERERSKGLPDEIHRPALRKLLMLDTADRLADLRVPPGNREGQHSIRVNDRWRICFRWRAGDAFDVEIVDYH